MNAIAAIALLALRNALRSRVVLVLLALLLLAAFLLPFSLRGDGTPDGYVRIHLSYTLGLSSFLLTLATLWAGGAAVSQEADEKTLQLLLVKPVPRLSIWLGKWIALLVVDALLLALVGAVSAATLQRRLRQGGFDPDALAAARQTALASHDVLRAPLPDVEADVRSELDSLRARRTLPEHVSESVLADNVRRTLLARRFSIPPGASRVWRFDPVSGDSGSLLVQFRCDSSVPGITGLPLALALDVGGRRQVRDALAVPGVRQTIVFEDPAPADGASPLAVEVSNLGDHGATLFFDPAEGLVVRQPAGTFAGNFLRALAMVYLRLALFAAIGVAFGTFFSMPVAAFLSAVLVVVLQLSGFISAAAQVDRDVFVANVAPFGAHAHSHGEAVDVQTTPAARALAAVLFYAYRGTWHALRPLLEDRTLDDLSDGIRIPPRDVLLALLRQGLLWPLALALLSAGVLRRREWALPAIN